MQSASSQHGSHKKALRKIPSRPQAWSVTLPSSVGGVAKSRWLLINISSRSSYACDSVQLVCPTVAVRGSAFEQRLQKCHFSTSLQIEQIEATLNTTLCCREVAWQRPCNTLAPFFNVDSQQLSLLSKLPRVTTRANCEVWLAIVIHHHVFGWLCFDHSAAAAGVPPLGGPTGALLL